MKHSITGEILLGDDDYSINVDRLFEEALREVYGDTLIQEAKALSPSLFRLAGDPLEYAVESAFEAPDFGRREPDFISEFHHNTGVFAAFKAHREQELLVSLLVDEEGNLRSFRDFRRAAQAANVQWNQQWLRTEYNTALRAARSAANYRDALRSKETYPNLEYLESRAVEKRAEHLELVGTIRPIEDPFWDTHMPPLDWNCKCSVRPTDKPVTEIPPLAERVSSIFAQNPGKTAEPVKLSEHPYLKGMGSPTCPECRRQGLVSEVENAYQDRGSEYCIAHRFVYLADFRSFAKRAIRSYKERRHMQGSVIIGRLDNSIQQDLRRRGITVYRTDAITDAGAVYKYMAHPKSAKGSVVPTEDIDYVVSAVLKPDKVYRQLEKKAGEVCYVMTTPYREGKVVKVVVHLNYYRKGRTYNYVKSWGITDERDGMGNTKYQRIK